MAQGSPDTADLDIAAQVAALRVQLDKLLERGGDAATGLANDMHRAAVREVDTLTNQIRREPVATTVFVLGGAVLGYLLGRAAR